MNRGHVVRLYPNKEQIEFFEKSFDATRFVYNKMLEINQKVYMRRGKSLSAYDMQSYLPKLKKQYKFLEEVNSQSLQITCQNLGNAFKKFFIGKSNFPKFKKKNQRKSFDNSRDLRQKSLRIEANKVKIPKASGIKFRGNVCIEGTLKRITIKKIANKYYASIRIDDGKTQPKSKDFNKITGIDLGLKSFAVVSNGEVVPAQKNFQKVQKELRRKQKALSRKVRGSKKSGQAKSEVARLYQRVSNQRKDFHHKLTKSLVADSENQAFAIEDLNVAGMVKNRRLAKSISDAGWSQFKTFLKYKAADVGKQVFEVDRFFPSSKTCSSCGAVNGDLKLSDRAWTCGGCKAEHDRDLNASLNIALEAARNVAGGDAVRLEVLRSNILSSVGEAIDINLN